MIERDKFIRETNNLIKLYKGKKSAIKNYLKTVVSYSAKLDTLKLKNVHDLASKQDELNMLIEIVCFYTDLEINKLISVSNPGTFLIPFDIEFMEYLLIHKKEIKGVLKWSQICELNYKYNELKVNYIAKGLIEDFNLTIGTKLKIKELWSL